MPTTPTTSTTADDRGRWATSVVLADGESAWVRPITPDDQPALLAFHERQPREDLYRRFFSPKPTLTTDELRHFTEVDFVDRVALVVERGDEFAAWASYERWPGRPEADVAFMVDHTLHGKGIATLLLEHLAAIARANGVTRFTADVLADNRPMLGVFARAGWPVRRHLDSGVVELEWSLDDTDGFLESVEARERRADSRSVARLLFPRSIAVVGASDRPDSVGAELWRSATRRSTIPVHAVNPNRSRVGDAPCVARITDIDDDVWLAVIACPVDAVPGVIDDCLTKRVRGAVLVSSGADLDVVATVERARRHGMRIVGPSSMGLAAGGDRGAASDGALAAVQALLAPIDLPGGNVAFSLQSGSLGASVLLLADRLGVGVSWFVSLGDKCDVSGNDLLQFWEDDERTKVIGIYTETFGNPRKFARVARRVGRSKPIVAVRTGAAANDGADALYAQAGLVEVPTVRDLLDTVRVASSQPLPAGPRVTVVTNARSPGVLARAALERAGLRPRVVDVDWSVDETTALTVLRRVVDDGTDAILAVHAPPVSTAEAPTDALIAFATEQSIPVVAVLLGREDGTLVGRDPTSIARDATREGVASPASVVASVPTFAFPEPAAAALGALWRHRRWRDDEAADADVGSGVGSGVGSEPGPPSPTWSGEDDARLDDLLTRAVASLDGPASATLASGTRRGRGTVSLDDTIEVLRIAGIDHRPSIAIDLTGRHDEAAGMLVAAATVVGYPCALKADVRRPGRSAAAGVALDLDDADDVVDAWTTMVTALGTDADHLVVQRMAPPGVDVRIHARSEARTGTIGPVIAVGLGGIAADAIGDEIVRLAPVGPNAALQMVRGSRAGSALADAGIDIAPLADVVRLVSILMARRPELAEVDLNPVLVGERGVAVVDARIDVVAPEPIGPLRQLG
jgi:acyl-CoA synthetase (NDP forming)/GNAT superfamily N-acetyltransferase